jgi:hypothetical protein
MIQPSAKRRLSSTSIDEPNFDPFPEPRTFPEGWDLSGMISRASDAEEESRVLSTSSFSGFLIEES